MSAQRRDLVLGSLLVALTLAVFGPSLAYDFVNYDDPVYVTENLAVQTELDIVAVYEAFTRVGVSGHWHPLTWLSLTLDYNLFGLRPWGYHLHNLLLHLASTLLLFVLVRWTTGAALPSFFVAALFAGHPLHVESVAWVSERKDALSTLFWMLTTLAYVAYTHAPSWRRYRLVLLCYVLGLLAKPMLVTLPATLLLLDYWPLARRRSFGALLVEKLPLFVLALGSAAMSLWAMQTGHVLRSLGQVSLLDRLANSVIAYGVYLRKLVWPVDLAPFYPLHPWTTFDLVTSLVVLLLLTGMALVLARRYPAVLIGWLWYLGTLVPVIGLVPVGAQAYADRFTYVPLIGVFVAVVWLVYALLRERLAAGILGTLVVACAVVASYQASIWRDSVVLWTHTLAVTRDNYLAEMNLAQAYGARGKYDLALPHLERAVALRPHDPAPYRALARLLRQAGREDEAVLWQARANALPP